MTLQQYRICLDLFRSASKTRHNLIKHANNVKIEIDPLEIKQTIYWLKSSVSSGFCLRSCSHIAHEWMRQLTCLSQRLCCGLFILLLLNKQDEKGKNPQPNEKRLTWVNSGSTSFQCCVYTILTWGLNRKRSKGLQI